MELREGYKQTEVGVIPEDWEVKKLGDIANYRRGSFPQPYGLPEWYDEVNGVPFIQVFDVDKNMKLKPTTKQKISDLAKDKSVFVKKGTVILTIQGSIGRIAVTQYDSYVDRTLLIFTGYKIAMDVMFFAFIVEEKFRIEKENAPGGIIKTITKEALSKFELYFPTKTEQTAIANALSDADALIQSLTRLITKKRQIKQGAMQTLLNPYENGRLKAGWVVKKLGDVVDKFIGGGTPSRSTKQYWGGDLPWVTVKDFATFNPYAAQESITYEGLKNSATHLIPKGTIITSTRMALGKAVVYEVDVCINQDLKAVIPTNEIFVQYMLFWFEHNEVNIADLGSGSTVMGLSLDELKKIDFPKPPVAEQTRIATILSDMDADIAALETKLAKTQQIKQGMMHNLLTGRIRLI